MIACDVFIGYRFKIISVVDGVNISRCCITITITIKLTEVDRRWPKFTKVDQSWPKYKFLGENETVVPLWSLICSALLPVSSPKSQSQSEVNVFSGHIKYIYYSHSQSHIESEGKRAGVHVLPGVYQCMFLHETNTRKDDWLLWHPCQKT